MQQRAQARLLRDGHLMRASPFARARWATMLAVVLTLVAIVSYPGGTKFDPSRDGYAWSQNFLSDLGMTVAYDGRTNVVGAVCFVMALSTLVVGVGGALVGFLRRYAVTVNARRFARAAGALGFAACVAFVGVALTPEDRAMQLHVNFTLVAFRLLPFATGFLALAARASGTASRGTVVLWTTLSAALAAYAALLTWGPGITSPATLATYVLAQKGIVVVMMGIVLYQCFAAELRPTVESFSS